MVRLSSRTSDAFRIATRWRIWSRRAATWSVWCSRARWHGIWSGVFYRTAIRRWSSIDCRVPAPDNLNRVRPTQLLLLFIFGFAAFAQAPTGEIGGTVIDASGAAL